MPLKVYFNVLKTGIYLSFLSVFLIFTNLLFPYITSKQLYFNILVEILMIFWLGLIIKYPEVRPKKSWVTFGLAAFLGALFVSSVFGVDFNLSFWGDVERMLGLFHVVHFFLFYLILITVFRKPNDWRNLFIISISAAALVCLYSLFKVHYSTIGNTAYVSGYAIFNIYFALILFFRRRDEEKIKHQNWLISALYLVAAFIMFLVMKETNTRGAYAGLGISFVLFFILSAVYSQSKKIKLYSLIAGAVAVVSIVLIFSFPQSKIVSQTPILKTVAQISSKQVTFQTRLISWKAALKDFPNHAILGTGYGNYAITFDKYFDPAFYTYTASETYFDRAHNNLVDIASTGGLISLLTYLSIFIAVAYYLFKGKKQGKISTNEFILLVCLFVAYFIQNLAVFDSLVTYISLMLTLGYVYWLINNNDEEEFTSDEGLTNKELTVLLVAGVIILSITYQYNIKVWQMLNGTIKGQTEFAKGNVAAGVEEYKKALSYNTPLDRDSRASLINVINGRQSDLSAMDKTKAKEIVDYVISLAEANVKLNSADSMMQMQLAQILNTAALVNIDNTNKFYFYSDRALKAIDESIKASPGRVTIYFSKAQIYLTRNSKDDAIKTLEYAASLNEKYPEAFCHLAKLQIYLDQPEEGYKTLDKCLDLNGANYLSPVNFVQLAINYYSQKNDKIRLVMLYEVWTRLESNNAKAWANLAQLYAQTGEKDKAIEAAQKAGQLDSSLKLDAEKFIQKLKQ
ncbi:MAG: O-antigen ligase family protein [Patescibacteria group bacterium]|jgi:O-antigen ligase/predicted Zn-dependent protease